MRQYDNCLICGKALRGRQKKTCSDQCQKDLQRENDLSRDRTAERARDDVFIGF